MNGITLMRDNTISKSHMHELANNKKQTTTTSMKSLKIRHGTVGQGLPPPHKNGCYTLVAIWKFFFLGSTQEFLGWPHRDAQGGLVLLVGVYLGPETARCCLTQPGPREGLTHFSIASVSHPPYSGFGTQQPVWRVQPVGISEHPCH